jgi:nucleotide-binding universal stress UspA family protein
LERPSRILVAVRLGDATPRPGPTAAWLATGLDATVTVVYVATELRSAAEVESASAIALEDVRATMLEEARVRAEEWGKRALADIPFDVVVEEGDVAERISAVAAEIGADLVVAGTAGRGAIKGMILGDTTREIVRHSPCPVVLVPADPEEG